MEHLYLLLSGNSASRLRLCASQRRASAPAGPAGPARGSARIGPRRVAAFIGGGRATRRRHPNHLAAGAASARGWGAFCRHRRNGAAAAALVQPNHPSTSAGPLLLVCRQQCRQLARPIELSRADRDDVGPFWTSATLVGRLRRHRRGRAGLRHRGATPRWRPCRLWRRRH